MGLGTLALELIVGFFSLLFMTRLIGKTQITQLTAFDFISALIMGELVGNAIYADDIGIGKVLFAVALWGLLMLVMQYAGRKSIPLRTLFEGTPSLVIQNGIIDREALKKNRSNIDELQTLLREKDIFSVREVEYAYLEPNGSLTVLRKPEFDAATLSDLKIPVSKRSLPTLLVSDGKILTQELQRLGKTEAWLLTELNKQGFAEAENVFFAEWRDEDGLHVITKQQPQR